MELKSNVGARSITSMSTNRENNSNRGGSGLLEEILTGKNLNLAYKRVMANKGGSGVDGMTVDELMPYLRENFHEIRQSLLEGGYKPKPVRRVEIPKPDGGKRLLGIPTVIDRMIQQAIAQVLSPIYEEQFLDASYGFRPGRNAKQAVIKCKEHIEAGYKWAVDIDLAKYFDTVNHDKLMRLLSQTISDGRVLSLIRKYLESGVMINGVLMETEEGTPQGGNLSPLLGNIMLHELDKELAKRGLRFCRYADDCNIYVKSKKSAERVMESITRFIEEKLKLRVNKEKSLVERPWKLKFLGFSFYPKKGGYGIRVHPKSIKKFKLKLKSITGRSNAMSMEVRMKQLNSAIIGWVNYFGIADMKVLAKTLDEWVRRRIRMCHWKQWKRIHTKRDNLVRLGIDNSHAWQFANSRKSYWRIAKSHVLNTSLTNDVLSKLGLPSIFNRLSVVHRSC